MPKTVEQLIEFDLNILLVSLHQVFTDLGQALGQAIRPDIAQSVGFSAFAFKNAQDGMLARMQADLQSRNGPVAKRLREDERVKSAFYTTYDLKRGVLLHPGKDLADAKEIIDWLAPEQFKPPENYWFETLYPYFPIHLRDVEAGVDVLTGDRSEVAGYNYETVKDTYFNMAMEVSVSTQQGATYRIHYTDVQPGGSVVYSQVTLTTYSSGVLAQPNTHSITVLNDQLEDATYLGIPAHFNYFDFLGNLEKLMVLAGYDKEATTKLGAYSLTDLEADLTAYFLENPLPQEIDTYANYLNVVPSYHDYGDMKYQTNWIEHVAEENDQFPSGRYQRWELAFKPITAQDGFVTVTGWGGSITCISYRGSGWDMVSAYRAADGGDVFEGRTAKDLTTLHKVRLDGFACRKLFAALKYRHDQFGQLYQIYQEKKGE